MAFECHSRFTVFNVIYLGNRSIHLDCFGCQFMAEIDSPQPEGAQKKKVRFTVVRVHYVVAWNIFWVQGVVCP